MGYTHFFQQLKVPTDVQWRKIRADAGRIISVAQDELHIPLAWDYDEQGKPPEVSTKRIRFNGIGEGGHETFLLPRVMEAGFRGSRYRFNFCKTARKPYDVVVGAILLSMWSHAPKCWDFGSDGEWEESEWQNAAKLYRQATGEQERYPTWLMPETA